MTDVDTVVIGAGVVGLAVARELAMRGDEVLVLERNASPGQETSTRNSGVIHAGIYYRPGSLRARLCVQGKQRLYEFCEQAGIASIQCGKLLVATTLGEVARLEALVGNARANGVDDLVMLDAAETARLEPEIRCAAACLSPSTGIVDAASLVTALHGQLQAAGGEVVCNTRVGAIDRGTGGFEITFVSAGESGRLRSRQVVIAAGHGASTLAAALFTPGPYAPPATFPARGHYYRLKGRHAFRRLVYPMPHGAWLGTHLTLDTAGAVRFGPDNEWVDHVDYGFDDSTERRRRFSEEIARYWPRLDPTRLVPDSVGVRPKIYRSGETVPDFAIHGPETHGVEGVVALYGIESPGLTAGLAIGAYAAGLLERRLRR